MYLSFKFIILLFGVLILKNVLGELIEGDLCVIPSSKINGICKLFSLCPSARHGLRQKQKIIPTHCGFKENEAIVCCVDNGATSATRSVPTKTTSKPITKIIQTPSTITQNVGDKSIKKCLEYGKYVLEVEPFVGYLGQPTPEKSEICENVYVSNIVGGIPAKPKEFPHMALIGFDREDNTIEWACGGSLISEKFVLSAAHCEYHKKFKYAKHIRLGELTLDSDQDDAELQNIPIKNVTVHPNYSAISKHNDIALFELDRTAILNSYVRPACLNTKTNITNTAVIASGWGRTDWAHENTNKDLLKVTLDLFTYSECKQSFENIDDKIQICAGSTLERKDTCQGDSGGPIQFLNSDEVFCTFKIVGITSTGKFCGGKLPAIYTRVSAYIKWIEDTIWP